MRSVLLVLALFSALPLLGCQAVAGFDRSLIPTDEKPGPRDGGGDDADSGKDDASTPTDAATFPGTDAARTLPDASDDDAGDDAG